MVIRISLQFITRTTFERWSKEIIKITGLTAAVLRHIVDIISQGTETPLVVSFIISKYKVLHFLELEL